MGEGEEEGRKFINCWDVRDTMRIGNKERKGILNIGTKKKE